MARETAAYQGVWVALRILVVDDSQYFRRSARELLMLRGFEVVDMAADGEEALAAVVPACPDGVLLDINLPGRDGYAVAASLVSVCPDARIVLTSSDVDGVPTALLMRQSFAHLDDAKSHGLATGHQYWFDRPLSGGGLRENRAITPTGLITASVEDMSRWLIVNLDDGV